MLIDLTSDSDDYKSITVLAKTVRGLVSIVIDQETGEKLHITVYKIPYRTTDPALHDIVIKEEV